MSKPVNHSLIGVFLLGALALLVGSVIAFSSFSFRGRSHEFVVYISDSLNGLGVNSDVKFKGVKIGSVKKIHVRFHEKAHGLNRIPVIIEIEDEFVGGGNALLTSEAEIHRHLREGVEQGLRARIQQTNLITGMLYIELDFFPGTPAVLCGNGEIDLPEIPTISSNFSQIIGSVARILENLAQIDFKRISDSLLETCGKMSSSVDALELEKINTNIVAASESAKKLLADPHLQSILKNADRAASSAANISEKAEADFAPLADAFGETVNSLRTTLEQINATAETLRLELARSRGSLREDIAETLEQLGEAARSVRAFSDYLQENPQALLFGGNAGKSAGSHLWQRRRKNP